MESGFDPKVDYIFKLICGDEDRAPILVDLLNAVLDLAAGKRVRGVALMNPFVEKGYAAGKVSILDIRARDDPGRQFLLEMQLFLRPDFAKRGLYYWARGHAEQLSEGQPYEQTQPTYLICFLNEALIPDDFYHHKFQVYDAEHETLLCKDLEIHTIELSKFNVPVEEVKTPLERWCYFFKHGASLDLDNLPATLDFPLIRQAVEVLVKLSQDELERQHYLERMRVAQDAASLAYSARAAEERAQIAEDRAQIAEERASRAQYVGRIQILQQLLEQPEASVEELIVLPQEDLLRMEGSLKQQLSGKKQANPMPPADQP